MSARVSVGLFVAGVSAATALLFAGPAGATNYTANCPGDSGNLQTLIDNSGPGDTITIYGTCYGNYTITTKSLTLQGGSAGATLNGRGSGTVLVIGDATVTIRNLTITNGNGSVGGISVQDASLTMTNSTVKGNSAFEGGGIFAEDAELDLTGVTITRNTALYQGGGIDVSFATLTMTASTVSNNTTTQLGIGYGGGGIRMEAAAVLLTSTKVTTNRSADYGGGIADYGSCDFLQAPIHAQQICRAAGTASGALRAAPSIVSNGLTLVNSSVDHNVAAFDGGGIYNESEVGDAPLVLQGSTVSFNNALDGDGGGIANYGECGNTASVLATKSAFQGNLAKAGDGGAVYNSAGTDGCNEAGTALVTIAQSPTANGPSVVNSNQARHGGGFANEQEDGVASLSLQPGAKVTGNKASITGGGVWNNCGSFSSLGQIMLNSPNNVVQTCLPF